MDRDYGRLPSILLHGPDVIELGRNCEELLESPCLNDPYEGGCCQRVTLTKVARLDLAPVIMSIQRLEGARVTGRELREVRSKHERGLPSNLMALHDQVERVCTAKQATLNECTPSKRTISTTAHQVRPVVCEPWIEEAG